MTQPKVAIIILHWGDPAETLRLLASLDAIEYPNYRAFLIDHTDQLKPPIGRHLEFIQPGKNLGYSGGNNLGMQKALDNNFEYALLLNNDTVVEPDFLNLLVEALESEPKAGGASPTILYDNPAGKIWFGGGEMTWKRGAVSHLGLRQTFDATRAGAPRSVSFLTGCSLLVRLSTVRDIGPLDDSYFLYWEDADWCMRALRAGYELLYVPKAVVTHRVSSGLSVNSPSYLYYIFRNNLLFIRKHVHWPWKISAWLYLLYKVAKEVAKIFLRYRRDYWQYFKMIWFAFYHNLIRRYGKL